MFQGVTVVVGLKQAFSGSQFSSWLQFGCPLQHGHFFSILCGVERRARLRVVDRHVAAAILFYFE